jgi:hypothetical protein
MALTFGIDTAAGETPQTVAQRRQMANLIAARMLGTAPKNVGEGLNAIGQALIARSMMGEADDAQKAGMASLPDFLKSQITGQPVAPPAAPSVSTPMGATSIPSGSIDPRLSSAISTASANSGIDPAYMTRLALVENGGKVEGGSPLSSAQGPFQFLSGTAKQYGLANPNDPAASADAAARLTLDNKAALTSALGREPTPGELYLAHQQGVGGAIKLLQNPNAPVESVIGAEAARNNAATPGMTAGQFANKWMGKFGDIVQTVDPAQKNVIDAQADSQPMAFAGTPTPMQPVAPQPPAGAAPVDGGADSPAAIPPAVQPATQPQNRFLFKNASDEDIQKALVNPFTPENVRAALTAEYKLRADAAQKAADPMRALDMQSKTLAIKKAQQDLNDRKTVVVNGRLVDAQTGELVKDYSTIGKTPEGTVLELDAQGNPTGLKVLANSPQDIKAKANQQKLDQQKEQQARSADVVTQDIDRALDLTKNATLPVTGSIGALTANLPGTTSHDVSALLTGIKANISFDRLQAMRAASPTGGALGNVSDQEGARLASAYGNLEQSQSRPQFERNLKRVKNIYLDIVHGPGNGPAREKIDGVTSSTPDRSAIEAEMKRRGLL